MNVRLVAPLVTLGLLVTVYLAAFRVAGAKRGLWRTEASDFDATEGSATDGSDGNQKSGEDDATEPEDGGQVDDDRPPAIRIGPRWDPGTTVALLAGAGGILTKNTTIFLAGVVGFAFAAYRYGTRPPEVSVAVEREIADRSPLPSDSVEITLTLRNEGDEPIPDLRVVDGVPERLGVVSGSPRHCTSLRPGERAVFSYSVRARRGTHEFGSTSLVARNVSGSVERRLECEAEVKHEGEHIDESATITCETRADDVPLPADTSSHPGHITTDSGGEGVEFYATREYQSADPMSRIDWKRYAKTQELTTVDFRETRAATVMMVVDVRTPAHVARREGEPDAVELGAYAAERLVEAFVRRNDRVGLALFGPEGRYLEPGGGDDQVARVRAELESTPPPRDYGAGFFDTKRRKRAHESRFETLRKRMPDAAQVVFLSPMADDYAVDVAERFRAYGHAVTVVSPAVSGSGTPGGAIEGIERDQRLADVRGGGIRVVDWSPDEPIRTAVSKATARWSG
ncbi:DUF58 domain-containing protein [Halorussus salinisoli]|uniref:DUF58 domain-containing protein n=1 Tax=Halorussus salinisoli TaxID=2558242 RepID=UPI002A9202F8|nr:DUF58 domain-containing protein [Halorussus salinisoli]